MTIAEAKWAFDNGVMVSLEIDPIKQTRAFYKYICELGYRRQNDGKVYLFATCFDRFANSVTRTTVSDVMFARKEDMERCHRELGTQNTQVL